MQTVQDASILGALLAEMALLARLLQLGWFRRGRYPLFTALVIAGVLQSLIAMFAPIPVRSRAYWWLWVCIEPVLITIQLFAVREACIRLRSAYPKIGKFGQSVPEWSFLAAVFVVVASAFLELRRVDWAWPTLSIAFLLERSLSAIPAATLVLITLFTLPVRRPIAPNLRRHILILTAYLGTGVLVWELTGMRALSTAAGSMLLIGASTFWFLLWIVALRKGGDVAPRPGPISPEDADEAKRSLRDLDRHIRQLTS
jgi:hypothetical protein